jgi:hypothetical protein
MVRKTCVKAVLSFSLMGICAAVLLLPASQAAAWSNGASGKGFGTHDWILVEANRIARQSDVGWVDLTVARPMTDYPDRVLRDFRYHAYDVWGKHYGSAPTKVADLFAQALADLSAGDYTGASETVGLLSHYFADVCDPLNTDASAAENRMHARYETAVLKRTNRQGENRIWVKSDGYDEVVDAAALTKRAASVSHHAYRSLVSQFNWHGYNSRVKGMTRSALNRAVNGLADIIVSLQQEASAPPALPTPNPTPTPTPTPTRTSTPTPAPTTPASSVSVTDYGAKGDGSADDTAAVTKALSAVSAKGGGTVYFPAGSYKVSQIQVPDGVNLQGAGMTTSWIQGKVIAGSHETLSDLKFGKKGVSFGFAQVAHYTTLERCRFRGGGGASEFTDGSVVTIGLPWGGVRHDHLTFSDCDFERNLGVESDSQHQTLYNTVRISEDPTAGGSHVEYVLFERCHFGVSNGAGGHDTGSPRMQVEIYEDSYGSGLVQGPRHIDFVDNLFEAPDDESIDYSGAMASNGSGPLMGYSLVKGNTFLGNGYANPTDVAGEHVPPYPNDVTFECGVRNVTVSGNTFYRGWGRAVAGVREQQGHDTFIEVTGNFVRFTTDTSKGVAWKADKDGDGVQETTIKTVSAPWVSHRSGEYVISLSGGHNVVADNVMVYGANCGTAVLLENATDSSVTGNDMTDARTSNGSASIRLTGSTNNTADGHTIYNHATPFGAVTIESDARNNRFLNNTIDNVDTADPHNPFWNDAGSSTYFENNKYRENGQWVVGP